MNIDPRLAPLGVKVTNTPNAKWILVSALYEDDTQSGGNHNIYFQVNDASGKPMSNVKCVVDWVGRDDPQPASHLTEQNGQTNEPINANLDIHLLNGPYFAYVEDPNASDKVTGMGLPEHHHVNFRLTFGPASAAPPPPPPGQTLEQTVQTAAVAHKPWMPINDGGALYKFALKNNLGYPQTDEFEFQVGADAYIGQVYNLGIVYVKKGDWGNCKWVKKP